MILLTGGTGFLGRHIIGQLAANGHQVKALARNPKANGLPQHPGLEWVEGDVTDMPSLDEAMQGVDQVIHAAAVVSFWPRRYAEMLHTNVQGTANVVDMALEHGVKKLVHVSSIAAIGRYPGIGTITAATKWKEHGLNSTYAVSKHRAELEVQRGVAEGLSAVIVNPGFIIGPSHDWHSGTARFWPMVHKGLKFYNVGSTTIIHVGDVAAAIRHLLTHGPSDGERFILGSENVEYRNLLSWIAEDLGKKAPTRPVNRLMARIAGNVFELKANMTGKEPLITRESTRIGSGSYQYESTPILQVLKEAGFQYTPVREAVRTTSKAFKESHGG